MTRGFDEHYNTTRRRPNGTRTDVEDLHGAARHGSKNMQSVRVGKAGYTSQEMERGEGDGRGVLGDRILLYTHPR